VNDLEAKMMKPITEKYMEVFLEDYLECMQQLEAEEEAGDQPQPQQPSLNSSLCREKEAASRVHVHLFTLCSWTTCSAIATR